jgi:hypothetical protein
MRSTLLGEIAPAFAVAKHPGLTWDEAVSEANARFGIRLAERAAFLRKYIVNGSPEAQLAELQLRSGGGTIMGGGISKGFVIGPPNNPVATIYVWVSQGRIVGEPTLWLAHAKIKGVTYDELIFDLNDCLISTNQSLGKINGSALTIGQNTTGEGGVNHYWAQVSGPDGESETIRFTPELVIKQRWVWIPNRPDVREDYEDGKLRRRAYYGKRQVGGGTETFVEREETFP